MFRCSQHLETLNHKGYAQIIQKEKRYSMKVKKIGSLLLAICLCVGLFSGCQKNETPSSGGSQSASSGNGEEKTQITLWGWEDAAFAEAITRFNKEYPNIEVIYTPVGSSEYVQKLQTALTTGTPLPDVACLEIDSRGKLFELDCWENLENGEYDFDRNEIVDYLIPLMTNPDGEIVCIDWQLCPSGIAYKRDLAKEYFGTDDPDELEALLPDWDAFIKEGVRVKEETDGAIKMFAGLGDINRIVFNQVTEPIVQDGNIYMDDSFGRLFDIQAQMRDAGIVGNLEIWSPAWASSFADDTHIFYPCSTWVPYFFIEANDPEGSGNWGLMTAPGGGYSWGGTAFAITEQSENKQAAWTFIKWMLLSEAGIQFNDEVTGYPTPLKAKYEDPAYISATDEFFGGQNLKEKFFKDLMVDMEVRPLSPYDVAFWDIVGLETINLNSDPNLTAEGALEQAKQEIRNKIPELEIVE